MPETTNKSELSNKPEMPDVPSPKDIALLYLKSIEAELHNRTPTAEQLEELVRETGWRQYRCSDKKMAAILDQYRKALGRMYDKTVNVPLSKRGL